MSVEVVMPQMGESITEGTVSKWLKTVGEKVEKDEPLLEISTDKVDAEVPSPSAGILLEIRANEGETVEVNSVVGVLGAEGESSVGSNEATQTPDGNLQNAARATESVSKTLTEKAKLPEIVQPQAISQTEATTQFARQNQQATEVVMPQMGESITEGTVSKWLKNVGDKIEKDEPLLEISTDKVDAEVPSPIAGTLLEIRTNEGETVEVGSVVALVGAEGASPVKTQASSDSQISIAGQNRSEQSTSQEIAGDIANQSPKTLSPSSIPPEEKKQIEETEGRSYDYGRPDAKSDVQSTSSNGRDKSNGNQTVEDLRRTKSSPLVRNIAKEHGIDISSLQGSGMSGRVTKKDIMSFIETGAALKPQDLLRKDAPVAPLISQPQTVQQSAQKSTFTAPRVVSAVGDRIESMSVIRKKIAEHMTFSKQTSAHVTSVYEVDMTNVAKFRDKTKAEFQSRYGTKLTFMPFIFQATINALREFSVINSQVSGEQIIYKGDINLGMAVALDWGLIVPVIKKADTLSLSGLALAANDLADRARTKKLNPDEVQGGTFTITNPGVFGGLFGTPIINQPQVAILCVGTIEKRPKVLTSPDGDDYIAIRSMAYFALTYDHRIVDGADAEKFLSYLKKYLETTTFAL